MKKYLQEGIEIGLTKIIDSYNNVILVFSDMAHSALSEEFINKNQDKILNLGIAEQNAVSFCGGLATKCIIPFYITYSSFITKRALDQIYNSIGVPNLKVILIGVKSGLTSDGGSSHTSINDIGILKNIPNMQIYEASSALKLEELLFNSIKSTSPIYIRVCYETIPKYNLKYEKRYTNQEFDIVQEKSITNIIITYGRILSRVLHASKIIEQKYNIKFTIVNAFKIFPIGIELIKFSSEFSNIWVIEEHFFIGGIYDELLRTLKLDCMKSNQIAINESIIVSGSNKDLLKKYKLDVDSIVYKVANGMLSQN